MLGEDNEVANEDQINYSKKPKIVIDGVIFQLQPSGHGGISRVWRNLIPELVKAMPEAEFLLLRRQGTMLSFPGIEVREIPAYTNFSTEAMDADDAMLGRVCQEEQATFFLSTYYSRALGIPNVMLVYDMIPEVMGFNLDEPEWLTKRRAFSSASSFVTISDATRRDLCLFYAVDSGSVAVAYPGLTSAFYPASDGEVAAFRERWGLHEPFFLLVGNRGLYKNGIAALRGFAASSLRGQARLIASGGERQLQPAEAPYAEWLTLLPSLSDDDLRCAYSAAIALIYPSQYEGFGLPVLEAMASGCPVITSPISSLPEVGGDACLYVDPMDSRAMAEALEAIGEPARQAALKEAGRIQAARFTWANMAGTFGDHLRELSRNHERTVNAEMIESQGESRFEQGDLPGAIAAFQMAHSLDVRRVSALNNLGVAYWQSGRPEEALSAFDSAMKIDPCDQALLANYGEALTALGQDRRARALYEAPLPEQPSTPEIAAKPGELPSQYLVSAIVSTYNAERFIRGCLEDLEAQTISDQLEIIVIDSGSSQNERRIVEEFQQRFGNIKYLRTEREPVYQAWNRGVQLATGKYLTNANTDDRHRPDAFERMVQTLEVMPEIALVYADVLITEIENETFADCHPMGRYSWLDWDRQALLYQGCFMGPQPMWRRSVHEEYGLFDESFITSGDYEFWLRISQTNDFFHIPEALGLYLKSPTSIEHSNRDRQATENERILRMYQGAAAGETLIRRSYQDDPAHLLEVHNRKGEELFGRGEILKSQAIFEQILERSPSLKEPRNNLGVVFFQLGEFARASDCFHRVLQNAPQELEALENLGNCYKAQGNYMEAGQWFKQLVELDPTNAEAREALEHCLQKMATAREHP